jgi:putative transposase
MPEYRRFFRPGGTFFFTLVTHERRPILRGDERVAMFRESLRTVQSERPFEIAAAVILPDHAHFIWTLPEGDISYPSRIGRLKILFTQSLRRTHSSASGSNLSISADRHRESGNWQRRYWEHVIRDERDFEHHLHYIHYNPVKHGYVSCRHDWPYSSFATWTRRNVYGHDWLCVCEQKKVELPNFDEIARFVGE